MTSKPVILVSRKLPPAVEARAARDFDARLNTKDVLYAQAGLLAAAAECGAEGLLICPTDKLDARLIANLPETVKIAASFSVGFDHIDLAAAAARGLMVTNTPDVLTDATADCAMLLLLGAARRASEGERLMRAASWGTWGPTAMLGTQVTGKRLGIFGMGRIGRALAQRARGFEMEIHYHDIAPLADDIAQGATYHAEVDGLLAVSDFLSLHCPSTPETRSWLNAERIARMPDGAIVVNSARGDIVDDEALIAALKSGKLAAAGLDVYRGEPDVHPGYRELDNTFLLPHLGSATRETRDAMGFRALDNLDAFFAGKRPGDALT
jgi:lactate dehydrogenase-like 2-hydroxyacid dehydrogenase